MNLWVDGELIQFMIYRLLIRFKNEFLQIQNDSIRDNRQLNLFRLANLHSLSSFTGLFKCFPKFFKCLFRVQFTQLPLLSKGKKNHFCPLLDVSLMML